MIVAVQKDVDALYEKPALAMNKMLAHFAMYVNVFVYYAPLADNRSPPLRLSLIDYHAGDNKDSIRVKAPRQSAL